MNWMRKICSRELLLALVIVCGHTASSAHSPNPGIMVGSLFPGDATTASQNAGAKGMDLDFNRDDGSAIETAGDSNLPIDIATASVTITINPAAPTIINCDRGTLTPEPGRCGFNMIHGPFSPPEVNATLRVVFGGLFPASTNVQIAVNGVRSADGSSFSLSGSEWEFLTSAMAPRAPVSLEMVFDVSGSMAGRAAPLSGCGPLTRMQALKDAAQSIFNILGSYTIPGDKLGLVTFTTTATAFNVVGGTNLKDATDARQRNAIRTNLNGQMPTAATSIGDGLRVAKASGFDGDTNTTKRVFLFSDGEQNTVPCAGEPNTPFCRSTVSTTPPLLVGGAAYESISVCPVTVGQFTGPAYTLQQNIKTATGCPGPYVHAITNDPSCPRATTDLTTFFTQSLANLLVGDKLELVRDVTGRVTGTDKSEKLSANTNDVSLSILVASPNMGQTPLALAPFRLKAPDGTIIDPSPVTQTQGGMSFTTIRLPLFFKGKVIKPQGEWEIQFPGVPGAIFDYHLIVLLDNENLASEFRTSNVDPGTGEPIPITVELTEDGSPITGVTVVAQLVGPENGVGNILSKAPTPSGTPNTGGDTIRSEAQRKLLLLLEDPASAALFRDKTLPSLVLLDNGQILNGDTAANDGTYSGLFTGALQEGHYRFVVNVRGSTAKNGDFQRTQLLNVYVRPKPVAANTRLALLSSAVQPDGTVIVRISATPRDRFDNFIGPDYLGHLNIRSSQGVVVTPLTDKLDGSYEISYRLPSASSNPDITVDVMGTDVVKKPLSDLDGGPSSSFKRWGLSLHGGSTFPHGFFGNVFDPGVSLGADLEYRFTNLFSVEAYLGHDRFKNQFFNDSFHLTHLSGHAKFTFGTGTVRPSVHAGLGAYFPEGGGTRFGGNAGASVQFWLTPNFAIEPSYNYRAVNFSGSTLKYSTLQGGIRFRF